jgi:hypothetical protein
MALFNVRLGWWLGNPESAARSRTDTTVPGMRFLGQCSA